MGAYVCPSCGEPLVYDEMDLTWTPENWKWCITSNNYNRQKGGGFRIMPFTEKCKSVFFETYLGDTPYMTIIFDDDTKQTWFWSRKTNDWVRDDKKEME